MNKRSQPRFLILAVLTLLAGRGFFSLMSAQQLPTPIYDLVIINGRVVDGAGNPWFRADVAIKDGRIARIGQIAPGLAEDCKLPRLATANVGSNERVSSDFAKV